MCVCVCMFIHAFNILWLLVEACCKNSYLFICLIKREREKEREREAANDVCINFFATDNFINTYNIYSITLLNKQTRKKIMMCVYLVGAKATIFIYHYLLKISDNLLIENVKKKNWRPSHTYFKTRNRLLNHLKLMITLLICFHKFINTANTSFSFYLSITIRVGFFFKL